MPYTLKVPAVMRVFKPLTTDALLLGDTYSCMDEGETLKVSVVCIASYDHDVKLAIQLIIDPIFYLLVEELCDESEELAYVWRDLYKSHVFAKTKEEQAETERKIEELYEKFRPILRKYIRPELREVTNGGEVAFLPENSGIRSVPLLHA